MIAHNAGDPRRIQHLIKVHELARHIGKKEGLAGEKIYRTGAGRALCDTMFGRLEE